MRITAQRSIKLVTLLLRRMILPIWRKRVAVRSRQKLLQALVAVLAPVHLAQESRGLLAPVDAAMLLASTTDAAHTVQRRLLFDEPREHQVDGLQPHGHGRKDLALGFVGQDALGKAILGAKVGVKVDLCFANDVEVGLNHNGCVGRDGQSSCFEFKCRVFLGCWTPPLSCWVERSNPRYNGPSALIMKGEKVL